MTPLRGGPLGDHERCQGGDGKAGGLGGCGIRATQRWSVRGAAARHSRGSRGRSADGGFCFGGGVPSSGVRGAFSVVRSGGRGRMGFVDRAWERPGAAVPPGFSDFAAASRDVAAPPLPVVAETSGACTGPFGWAAMYGVVVCAGALFNCRAPVVTSAAVASEARATSPAMITSCAWLASHRRSRELRWSAAGRTGWEETTPATAVGGTAVTGAA